MCRDHEPKTTRSIYTVHHILIALVYYCRIRMECEYGYGYGDVSSEISLNFRRQLRKRRVRTHFIAALFSFLFKKTIFLEWKTFAFRMQLLMQLIYESGVCVSVCVQLAAHYDLMMAFY